MSCTSGSTPVAYWANDGTGNANPRFTYNPQQSDVVQVEGHAYCKDCDYFDFHSIPDMLCEVVVDVDGVAVAASAYVGSVTNVVELYPPADNVDGYYRWYNSFIVHFHMPVNPRWGKVNCSIRFSAKHNNVWEAFSTTTATLETQAEGTNGGGEMGG